MKNVSSIFTIAIDRNYFSFVRVCVCVRINSTKRNVLFFSILNNTLSWCYAIESFCFEAICEAIIYS